MAEFLSARNGIALTTADLAIVYTIANSVGPITMITGGSFNDKFGPKKVILVGGIMVGAGMIASGFATSVGALVVTYGLIFGLGLGMTYGTAVSTCMKFFPDKRGLIGGITTAIYGLGSVILPPVVTKIVSVSSAPAAFKIIGIIFLIIICGCSFFMEQCPADFVPDGWTPPVQVQKNAVENKNWKEMIKTPVFYVMLLLFTCGAFSGMMVISQASAVATNMVGMTAIMASTAVSVLAVFNAGGRILAGFLSDRIGRINTCLLQALPELQAFYFYILPVRADLPHFILESPALESALVPLWVCIQDLQQTSLAEKITASTMESCSLVLQEQGISDHLQ